MVYLPMWVQFVSIVKCKHKRPLKDDGGVTPHNFIKK